MVLITSKNLGPVVQSILSLTSSLRGQLLSVYTSQPNTLKFFVEKLREAFAMQKLTHFSTKNEILTFEILTTR